MESWVTACGRSLLSASLLKAALAAAALPILPGAIEALYIINLG
jgi:hypothetical protein